MIRLLTITSVLLASATSYSFAESNKPMLETKNGSIITFGCPKCEPEEVEDKITLEQGSQFLEVRQVGEDLKIYRTENWLGGSPVSYVHMPSNPEDKRFSALEVGPIDGPGAVKPLDIAPVASIDSNKAMDLEIMGPKKPEMNDDMAGDMVKEIALEDSTDIEPVVASVEMEVQPDPPATKELDSSGFKLRLN